MFRPTRSDTYRCFIRFYSFSPLLRFFFETVFREPRQIFHAIDKKETRELRRTALIHRTLADSRPVDVIESDIDG